MEFFYQKTSKSNKEVLNAINKIRKKNKHNFMILEFSGGTHLKN